MACNCGGNRRSRDQVTSIEIVAQQEAERAAQAAAEALILKETERIVAIAEAS